jgi:hypothetical protein
MLTFFQSSDIPSAYQTKLNHPLKHKQNVPCGGSLQYLHRSPASRKRLQKSYPVPGCITRPTCHWETEIQRPGPPGWGLDARLKNLLFKKLMLQNSKKCVLDVFQNVLRNVMLKKRALCCCYVKLFVRVRVRVTLQLTVSESVYLGVEPNLGLLNRDIFFFKLHSCLIWGALSDERPGQSFVSLQSVHSSQSVFT